MVSRYLALVASVALLAACATAAQRQAETIKATMAVTAQHAKACFESINVDPTYAELARHFPLMDVRGATLGQQTDPSYATPREVELLSARHERQAACRRTEIDGFMISPPIGVVWMDLYAKADANLLELAKRHITWGDYVSRNKALADDLQPQLVAAAQRVDAELKAEHRQEMQQRATAAQALSNAMYQQQLLNQNQQIINQNQMMINSANRPVMTNCNRFGNMTNCTSY